MYLATDFRTSTVTVEMAPAEMPLKPSQAHESFPEKHNAGRMDKRNDTLWLTSDQVKARRLHLRTGCRHRKSPPEPQRRPSLEERPKHSCLLSSEGPAATRQPREDSGAKTRVF